MNPISRGFLLGALTLLLFAASCNLPSASPTPIGTILPNGQVASTPTVVLSIETATVVIPVTGGEPVSLQCQFCVNNEPHAVLLISESALYHVSDTAERINCLGAQVVNGRRIVLCRGAQQASFNFNVCVDGSNCLQYPVTLEICPLKTQTVIGTPVVLTPINAGIVPTLPAETSTPVAVQTVVLPTSAAVTTVPPPSQTVVSPPPVVGITASPSHAQPIRPGTPQPASGLQDPAEFARWYFNAVWQTRNYQDLWNNYLTQSFKNHASANDYEGYALWWNSVERVDVSSVEVIENDGTHAWVHLNATFTMKDGRVIANQEYDYDLFYDATRRIWMFDYRGP